jgi:cation diffusion facilitator CzcD-associated flavoprotein CzcO
VNYDEPAATAAPELIQQRYEAGWAFGGNDIVGSFNDLTTDQRSNDTLAGFLRGKIRQIVRDSQTAQTLTAQDYPVGAKRMCLGTDYFETFNRENVTLVDLRSEPIEDFTPDGSAPRRRSTHWTGHLRHGLRRHDWRDLARRYPWPRRVRCATTGKRPAYVPGPGQRRFPQPLLHHRTGQPSRC